MNPSRPMTRRQLVLGSLGTAALTTVPARVFAAEYPEQFSWDYLEEGPEDWRVRIGRTAAAPAA